MKKLLSVALLGLTFSAFAKPQICSYVYTKEGSTLGWTAFKTPKKVGVNAKFSDFTITPAKNAKSIPDLLTGASFEANSQSVDSGDKGRNIKIQQFFFKSMLKGTKITGKVLKVTDDSADVEMTMNGTTKTVKMTSKYDEAASKLNLTGTIDVFEFGMQENLAAITKACYEKHEGKTWSDVNLDLTAIVKQKCN